MSYAPAKAYGKPRPIEVADFNDFRGGLNLRADAFMLQPNESPDMLNVEIDPRGGFRQRRGTIPLTATDLGADVLSMATYSPQAGAAQVLISLDNLTVRSTTGGVSTLAFNRRGPVRAATFKDLLYAVNGVANGVRWDGSTATALGMAWANDLAVPGTGNMPFYAYTIAAHIGQLWVANTSEAGTAHKNRVRWSHPNQPESWRAKDFIDIDTGVESDEITALAPWNDHLIVFKRGSTHAVYGYNHETFQVVPKSQSVGAVSQEAVAVTEMGVFFWSQSEGLFFYDQDGVHWLFEPLYPAIEKGDISPAASTHVHVGWVNRRVWVSVPYKGSAKRNRTFVYDPTIKAWTAHDLAIGAYAEWEVSGRDTVHLAAHATERRVLELERLTNTDNFDGTEKPIAARLRTAWVDLGNPAMRKRWKRPQIVLKGGTSADIFVKVYRDWDPTYFTRTFNIDTEADGPAVAVPIVDGTGTVVDGTGWDTAQWNVAQWGRSGRSDDAGTLPDHGSADALLRNELHRGSPLGTAYAIALEFIGPTNEATWGVDSLTFKFKPKRIRG